MTHEFLPNKKGLCKQYIGGRLCHLPEDSADHARWRAKNPVVIDSVEVENLKAEIARLRGALRAAAIDARLIAGCAETNLILTPEDMLE